MGKKPSGMKRNPRTYAEVIDVIRRQGYVVKPRSGHTAVLRPNGTLLFKFGCTPSDTRGARQTLNSFRRAVRENG